MRSTRRNLSEIMRDEMTMRDRLRAVLANEGKTIPEMAEVLGMPSEEVLVWVMGMRRYGLIQEKGRADENGYFTYTLASQHAA